MKLRFIWRREHGPIFAWLVTLLSTGSYLGIVAPFDVRPILLAVFILLTVAVLAYWIFGEPSNGTPHRADDKP